MPSSTRCPRMENERSPPPTSSQASGPRPSNPTRCWLPCASPCGRAGAVSAPPSSRAATGISPSPAPSPASRSGRAVSWPAAPSPCSAWGTRRCGPVPWRRTSWDSGPAPCRRRRWGGSPSSMPRRPRRTYTAPPPIGCGSVPPWPRPPGRVRCRRLTMPDSVVSVRINGAPRTAAVESRKTLADFLREDCRLTGTHLGCEHGVCGACTVLVDGLAVRACLMFAVQAEGTDVTTVEGLAPSAGELSAVQRALHEEHGLQCGFCTPGLVVSITAFLRDHPHPTDAEVRDGLSGNLCRCTGYQGIIRAV